MNSINEVKINRKLEEVHRRKFSHTFPGWGESKKMVISGDQVPFNEVFIGFDQVAAIRRIFGDKTDSVLAKLPVGIFDDSGYAWIDNQKGRLRFMISRKYLLRGRKRDIYLDVVHELVHVRQHMQGKGLFDDKYAYVDRPTEIEAYRICVKEGKRLGMTTKEVKRYLRVPWVPESNFRRLYKNLDL